LARPGRKTSISPTVKVLPAAALEAAEAAREDQEPPEARFGRDLEHADAVRGIRNGALEEIARTPPVHHRCRSGAVHHHAPRALGLAGRDQGGGRAIRADQQVDLLLVDQAAVELGVAPGVRAVVEHAQLDAPAEQPAVGIHRVAPELDAARVLPSEVGLRAGLRDHGADHNDRSILRQGSREAD